MRISVLENSPDLLRVRMTPTAAIPLATFGLLLIVGGAFVAWILSDCSELSVTADHVRYRKSSFGRFLVEEQTLPIAEVEFGTRVYKDAMSQTRDVTLSTESGDVRIPFPALGGDEKKQLVADLTAAAEQGRDYVTSSGAGTMILGIFFGGLVAGGGLVCLYFLQSSSLVCSQTKDEISVAISRWLIPGSREDSVKLSDFSRVDANEMKVGTNSTPTASSNYVFIRTKSGQSLRLASGPMFTDASTAEVSDLIESWCAHALGT